MRIPEYFGGIKANPHYAESMPHKYYKWEVLALLWAAFFLNQADRQVFNTVLPLIQESMKLTAAEVGLIATIFNLVFALLVPISGYLGDRFSKKAMIVSSIVIWSSATMLTGLSTGVLMFIVFRSFATGLGEAMFGPANYSTIADYHKSTRAVAMSIHQTSYYFGVIASGFLAGYIGQRWGWRSAFLIFGAVGVLHGFVMFWRLRDKTRPEGETPEARAAGNSPAPEKIKFAEAMRALFRVPTAVILTACFAGLIFVLTGYLTWTPTFLYEKFSMSLADAGFNSMFYTHLAAFAGILIAGKMSDRLAVKKPSYRILMQSAGLLAATPFIVTMGHAQSLTAVYIGLAGFGFARAFFDANTYPVLYDVIPEKYRSSAAGVMLMIGFAAGSFSPLILGAIKPHIGLSAGISMLAAIWAICSVALYAGYKFLYMDDCRKARECGAK